MLLITSKQTYVANYANTNTLKAMLSHILIDDGKYSNNFGGLKFDCIKYHKKYKKAIQTQG